MPEANVVANGEVYAVDDAEDEEGEDYSGDGDEDEGEEDDEVRALVVGGDEEDGDAAQEVSFMMTLTQVLTFGEKY